MRHLELDITKSTPNPLYVPKPSAGGVTEAAASSPTSDDDHTHTKDRLHEYLHCIVRLLLLLVLPILGIWGWDNVAQIRPHMLSWTYVQITYAVVVFVSTRRGSAGGTAKAILGVLVGLYVVACVVIISLPATQISIPSDAGKTARCACTGCQYLAKADVPVSMHYQGLFPRGQDGVMAIGGASVDGTKRLSLRAVIQGSALVGGFASRYDHYWSLCEGVVGVVLFGGLVGPCDASCTMQMPNSAMCYQAMKNTTCLNHLRDFASRASVVAYFDHLSYVPLLPNPTDDALVKEILRYRADSLDKVFAHLKNGNATALCAAPELFDVDPKPLYNCTVNTAPSAGQDTVRWISHAAPVAQVVWSVLAIAHCAVTAGHTRTVTEEHRTPKYHVVDRVLLFCSIVFLFILSAFLLLCLRLLDPGITVSSPWEQVVGHTMGALFAATAILASTTCLSLRERRWQHFETKETHPIMKWYRVFETMVDIDDGAYYFQYAIACEVLEIMLQFSTLNTMVRTNDVRYVMASTTILSVNLVATPLAHFSSFYSDAIGRKATYIADTLLESAYVFLNLSVARRADLLRFPVLLSLLIPLVTLVSKTYTFIESTTTYIENRTQRGSWVAKLWASSRFNTSVEERPSISRTHAVPHMRTRCRRSCLMSWNFSGFRYMTVALCLCGGAMALSGVFLFTYTVLVVQLVDTECGRQLGTEVWAGAAPRRIFLDGFLKLPKCHFSTVLTVEARNKGLTTLTPQIGDLVNLERLVLTDNDIVSLPKKITTLQHLTEVDLSGNPVWTRVSWQHQGFQTFPQVLFHFPALEELDLGHNDLSTIPDTVTRFSNLRVLILQNNSIHRHGLPVAIASMPHLERLEVVGNPVARTLTWHGVRAKDLFRLMEFWKDTLEDLDVSQGTWTSDATRFLLQGAPALLRLNVSENRLTSVDFKTSDLRRIKMLDVSRNPVTSVSWETFVALDTVWKRGGVVWMIALQVVAVGIYVPRERPANMFPYRPIEHFVKHSVNLMNLRFYGTGKETFPVCAVPHSVGLVFIKDTVDLNVECVCRWLQVTWLEIARTNLKTIDASQLTQVSFLHLNQNNLETVDISQLTQLRSLRLDGNRFNTSVPTAVRNNSHLECLNLRNNSFSGGMDWLQDMANLRWLDLRHNKFHGQIPEIHSLAPLEFLGLGSSGFVYNESYILSRWPKLEKHGDYFLSKGVDFSRDDIVVNAAQTCLGSLS